MTHGRIGLIKTRVMNNFFFWRKFIRKRNNEPNKQTSTAGLSGEAGSHIFQPLSQRSVMEMRLRGIVCRCIRRKTAVRPPWSNSQTLSAQMLTLISFSRIQQGAVLRGFLRAQVLIYAAKPLFPLTEQSDPDAPFPMVKLHLHPQE